MAAENLEPTHAFAIFDRPDPDLDLDPSARAFAAELTAALPTGTQVILTGHRITIAPWDPAYQTIIEEVYDHAARFEVLR